MPRHAKSWQRALVLLSSVSSAKPRVSSGGHAFDRGGFLYARCSSVIAYPCDPICRGWDHPRGVNPLSVSSRDLVDLANFLARLGGTEMKFKPPSSAARSCQDMICRISKVEKLSFVTGSNYLNGILPRLRHRLRRMMAPSVELPWVVKLNFASDNIMASRNQTRQHPARDVSRASSAHSWIRETHGMRSRQRGRAGASL